MKRLFNFLILGATVGFLASCGGSSDNNNEFADGSTVEVQSMVDEAPDPMENKGIGPISSVTLGALNQEMANLGEEKYKELCTVCHQVDKKLIGPSPKGILDRRSPEWVMNIIMNPEEMLKNDPIAKQLLIDHNMVEMTNQNVSEEDARAILEYFRTLDSDRGEVID